MKKIFLILILSAYIFASTVEEAKKLFSNKQYEEALIIFNEHEDHPVAQYYLGKIYFHGLGVEKDEIQALVFLKQSAKQGNSNAMLSIGEMYSSRGNLIKKDYNKAIKWFDKAIKNGNYTGYLFAGNVYYFNLKNNKEALKNYIFYEKFYKLSMYANQNIGYIYKKQKNYKKAYIYFTKAAKLGDKFSMIEIYQILIKHPSLASSVNEGLDWVKQAAKQKYEYAYGILANTEKQCSKKFVNTNQELYNIGYMPSGCNLASCYQDIYTNVDNLVDIDYSKSFDLSSSIIAKQASKDIDVWLCYYNLSTLYRSGRSVAKDINKSIDLSQKDFFMHNEKNDMTAIEIADMYLYDLQDYKNAEKWYKTAYNLTKEKKYLSKVNTYKTKLSKYTKNNTSANAQNVFPTIDNLSSAEQVVAEVESQDSYFIATDQKTIRVYDKSDLKFIKELRGWIGSGLKGTIRAMAFDEDKQWLYFSQIISVTDFIIIIILSVYLIFILEK